MACMVKVEPPVGRTPADSAPPTERTLANILVVDDDRLVLASIAQTRGAKDIKSVPQASRTRRFAWRHLSLPRI